jgi:tripartite-type tricarboxylate transporter receptor subunit TctC
MNLRRVFCGLALLFCNAAASAYPDHPVRIVLGFPAGGGADVLLRAITPGLADELGQPVFVDNRPGAGGNLGMGMVAQAAPDGYTLLMAAPGLVTNASLYENLQFNPAKDFVPIGMVGSVTNVLVVNPALPVGSVAQLVEYARLHPGQINYASSGIGTSLHLAGALFERDAGIHLTHVPYRGGPAAIQDLMSGQVQMMFSVLPLAMPHIKAGKLRALAVTDDKRSAALPGVPTMIEAGIPGYTATTWNGLVAPAGTPPAIIRQLNAALSRVLQRPEVRERFAAMGQDVVSGSPEDFGRLLLAERAKWDKLIKEAGIKAE